MRPLALDYCHAGRSRPAAYVLMAAAVGIACYAGIRYEALTREIGAKEQQLARIAGRPAQPQPARARISPEEYAFASQAAWRLSLPWERLFGAFEAASKEQVALLAIEPDVDNHSVSVSGEAKSYLAALSYVADLSEQRDAFAGVYLLRHEIRKTGGEHPVAFTLSATWPGR